MAYNDNRNNNNNNNNNGGQQVKRSGATYTKLKNGKYADSGLFTVKAWRKTKFGLQVADAYPYGDGTIHVGKLKKHEHVTYTVTISNQSMGTSQVYYTLMRLDTQKINIPELGLVISPNGSGRTASGKNVKGFFGRNRKQ